MSVCEFKIVQNHKTIFTIQLIEPNEILLKSLKYLRPSLTGLTINTLFTTATFQASSVSTLLEYKNQNIATYELTLCLIKGLSIQLKSLKNNLNHTFYEYNPSNVILIDSTQFIYMSSSHLICLDQNKTITFNFPFEKSEFSAPEILNIYSLPTTICDRASYYSLGILTIYCLLSLIPRNEIEIKEALIPINQTKIYWFLLKVLDKDSSKRVILFI
jgi:hypothetical protein